MSQAMPPAYPGTNLGMKPHRAAVILVLGILGLVVCFICGIIAWVMGNADLREMDAGRMDPTGRGMTQAGKIIGIVSTILGGLWFIIMVLWMIFGVVMAGAAAASGAGHP